MPSENTLCNEVAQLLLGETFGTFPKPRIVTGSTTLSPNEQWCTMRPAIAVPDTVVKAKTKNYSPLEQSSLTSETSQKQQQAVIENTLVSTQPPVKIPFVIGTKMHLSFVKIALPACKDVLAPLSKLNTEVTFLSSVAGRRLHWILNYVPESGPSFEDPEENIPEKHLDGETTEERSVRFLEHNVKCLEYQSAHEAQNELELMLKEAMDDDMLSKPLFPRFPELAPEIQDMIWDLATEEERIIEVHLWKRCAEWMIIYASTDAKNPALLSVCKASRERGLLKYKVLSINNSWRRDKKMYDTRQELLGLPLDFIGPGAATTNFRCYINYDTDTIFINTQHSRANEDAFPSGTETWREAFGYQFLKDLYFSPAGDQIKSLAIDYRVAEKWLNTDRRNWQYCQVFAAMPLLRKLAVVWADHEGLGHLIEKECCNTQIMIVETAGEPLTDEDRYGAKFPCQRIHRRVKNLKEIDSSAADFGDNRDFENFASGKTATTWKGNIMTAVRDNRPKNPADVDSFHFVEGRSRYRDLDDLELFQVHAEREKSEDNLHGVSLNH